ncbi:unnamed protein product [Durusdinium trenchii]|uniref:Geranylgeranyl transferase type II subunit beta n=1 Tax=Durusdinium trenchii TaxID=1381693 RepID=A0ABP0Q1T6_9DINO
MATHEGKSKFTLAEAEECVKLMVKARRCGVWDSLLRRVIDTEDVAEELAWEKLSAGPSGGTMNDSSKRLRDDPGYSTTPYAPAASDLTSLMSPMPSTGGKASILTPSIELPSGVESLAQWGQTLVSFGKYKGMLSYHELMTSNSEGMESYRQFLYSHAKSGSAGLKDVVNYMRAHGGKKADACYTWWTLAAAELLAGSEIVSMFDLEALEEFVEHCMSAEGGVAPHPHDDPDPFHTFFGLAGLSLVEHAREGRRGLKKMEPTLVLPAQFS